MRLAELMGVSFATINRWENGQARPSALAWRQILRAERVGIDGLAADYGESAAADEAASTTRQTPLDFSADSEAVRLVAEAERLAYGHLFNPAFAAEISLIDPLPHQRIAVYQHMLGQNPLRFLLADDAGAGKTIMAGLYVRELLARRLIRRVLVIPPAGLVGNWERELRKLFSLRFRIVSGLEARASNPFAASDSDLVVVSVDTLASDRMFARLQEPATTPYDLVIFDEAHKLSARREPDFRMIRTDRYRLAEAVAGIAEDDRWRLEWRAHHLLLLTATPHMGKDFPYYCLWRLLQPEALATYDAFGAYGPDGRRRHFLRRTKEEMLKLDGSPLYPTRVTDTLSYELGQGEISEQTLYDETTRYIRTYYNRARILNRSAARLAMSVFQRRLASSTYALLRSFERRLAKLDALIEDVRSGRVTPEQLALFQQRLKAKDVLNDATADEEAATDGREQNEDAEGVALGGVVAVSLAEVETERQEVERLRDLARRVYDLGEESKFEKLSDILRDPRYRDERLILFTEHRDTAQFLLRRLEGAGFAGRVAWIHGGMDHEERDEQVEFFRKPYEESGATYLVGTDAAGEGINLQFCWLMVNYDIPWNPARLEQRMGRIHRYGQRHDPVVIVNLVAGKTREGRVLKTLLDKLESIRKQLGSDKVFDVIGRLFEDVSIKDYMDQALADDDGPERAQAKIEGTLTKEQVEALAERQRRLYGDGGDVRALLPALKDDLAREELRRLLPGYVRRFIEKAAPALGIVIDGDPGLDFQLRPAKPGAVDALLPVLETYPERQRRRLTVYRPEDREGAIFLHPGEPVFEALRGLVLGRFSAAAVRGAVFVDPGAKGPWLFHLALVEVIRRADPAHPSLSREERLECRLVGLRQYPSGEIEECPVEYLLLLRGGTGMASRAATLAATASDSRDLARTHALDRIARPLAEKCREEIRATLDERKQFLLQGFDYQEAELAANRAALNDRVRAGDARASAELTRVKDRQRSLGERRDKALGELGREPELVDVGELVFLAHALVLPSSRPEDRQAQDDEVEAIAMAVARAHEEALGGKVRDVSKPPLARAAGLNDCPGFDLLSRRPDGSERGIEVKGRAAVGDIELTENEWAKACNLRERYWLYVVFDCASPHPRLLRVQDPFGKLLAKPRGGVLIDERAIVAAADPGRTGD